MVVLGSVQVRIAAEGEVWVVTGDYKRCADPTCEPFEVVPCDALITGGDREADTLDNLRSLINNSTANSSTA